MASQDLGDKIWGTGCATPELRTLQTTSTMVSVIIWCVIRSFRNQGSEDIFDGFDTPAAHRTCPPALWKAARRKLDQINRVRNLLDPAVPPGNRLERLKFDRSAQYSIRINEQYRVCFRRENENAHEVEITDCH